MAVSSAACGFRGEPPAHHNRVEVSTDSLGRVVSKKFDQVIDYFGKRGVVTVTQRFDTSGRLVSEYGTDHPYYGKHYLYEFFYEGGLRVINHFRWPEIDTSSRRYVGPANSFFEQKIFFDTTTFIKYIRITRVAANAKNFIGRYYESTLMPRNAPLKDRQVSSYTFKVPVTSFLFDNKSRLVLTEPAVVRIKDY